MDQIPSLRSKSPQGNINTLMISALDTGLASHTVQYSIVTSITKSAYKGNKTKTKAKSNEIHQNRQGGAHNDGQ